MSRIYAIGETLLDIIFRDNQPQTAKAGGSMLNSVVSLGRLSLPVSFLSEYGYDEVGNIIDQFLKENGVDTSHVHRFNDGKTALALAFLNDRNDAQYSFYKNYPVSRLDIRFPSLRKGDIVLCGSFYALSMELRPVFKSFISGAKEKGTIVIYDPNFRKSHLNELKVLKPLIVENMQMATLVRGSDEDFRNIFTSNDADEAWETVRKYCKCMIYTSNADGVYIRSSSFSGKFPVRKINPVSTIGAGDNFNAGIIASFFRDKISATKIELMQEKEWNRAISMAVDFASHVCMSYENYISRDFAKEIME